MLIIDEFGKGTNPEDGIALFLALTHYFISRPFPGSFYLLSTHFSDYLIEDFLGFPLSSLTFKQMNVLINKKENEAITPLYQVIDGVCEDSLGIEIALLLGFNEWIIKRASEIYDCLHTNKKITLQEDLVDSKNTKIIDQVIDKLFSFPDWTKATGDDLQCIIHLLNSIG